MSSQIFPTLPGLDIAVKRTQIFSTQVQAAASGKELRATWWSAPKWQYDLTMNFLRNASFSAQTVFEEAGTLVSFHGQHKGAWDSFLFQDPYDSADTLMGFGVGNGSTTVFQLQRREPGQYSTAYGTFAVPTTPRTNLFLYSTDVSNAAWTATRVTFPAGNYPAPDGTTSAKLIMENGSSIGQSHTISQSVQITAGLAYTISVCAKSVGGRTLILSGSGCSGKFDLTNGVVIGSVGTAAIVSLGNGWYRASVTQTATTTVSAAYLLQPGDSAGLSSYLADGSGGLLVWGIQLEVGSAPTDYIPTTSAAATVNPTFYPSGAGWEPVTEPLLGGIALYIKDGLGIQPLTPGPRTNQILGSQEFDNAVWVKQQATITANSTAAPDGTTTADSLVEDTSANQHGVSQLIAPLGTYQCYTTSICVKPNGRTKVQYGLTSQSETSTVYATFDLSAGTIYTAVAVGGSAWFQSSSITASMTPLANGWFRLTVTAYGLTPLITSVGMYLRLLDSTPSTTYTGDGASGVYLWGAQLEAGRVMTSYLFTSPSSNTTRTDYTITATGAVTFAAAPPANTGLLWSGTYYRRCRFDQDELTLERIVNLAWKGGSIKLLGVK